MNIYITADTHFGHDNIRNLCHRPYDSVDEMNAGIISTINQIVKPKDTLYHLGDFCWWNKRDYTKNIVAYREQINCTNIHLILGNHDFVGRIPPYLFQSISVYQEMHHSGVSVVLCHYPIESWNKKNHGSVHMHGHCHGNLTSVNTRRLDVGWDVHHKPLLLSDAVQLAIQNGGMVPQKYP